VLIDVLDINELLTVFCSGKCKNSKYILKLLVRLYSQCKYIRFQPFNHLHLLCYIFQRHHYLLYLVKLGLPAHGGAENLVSTKTFCIPSSFFSNL
jgi:hypothetical protein